MSLKDEIVEHPGVVIEVADDHVKVKILQVSACAACHAKGACSMADMEEKVVDVEHYHGSPLEVGSPVTLTMMRSSGNRAILLGYLMPFAVLIAVMIVTSFFVNHEGLLALISISALIPYYLILFQFRDRLKKGFLIRIK
jgi:sigma-E factor negative regulatory protein RseC